MSTSSQWCTIESDPGVFTSLVESFGVRGVEFTELYSLDDDILSKVAEEGIYGLIFLFKHGGEEVAAGPSNPDADVKDSPIEYGTLLSASETPPDLFFARQVTGNACATQAILSVLINAAPASEPEIASDSSSTPKNSSSTFKLGKTLSDLREFTRNFDAGLRGEMIGASEEIRTAHNSFARADALIGDDVRPPDGAETEDVFHFVAYVPHPPPLSSAAVVTDGAGTDANVSVEVSATECYELDGLCTGPVRLTCASEGDNATIPRWLRTAREAIQKRIARYPMGEVKFNLMAVVRDKRATLQQALRSATLASMGVEGEAKEDYMGTINELKMKLMDEGNKRAEWQKENERRRHNYLPFCFELIRALAASGKMDKFVKGANEKVEARKLAFKKA